VLAPNLVTWQTLGPVRTLFVKCGPSMWITIGRLPATMDTARPVARDAPSQFRQSPQFTQILPQS